MAHRAPSWWFSRNLIAASQLPMALLFVVLAALRRLAWRTGLLRAARMPVPVIVVGNIAAGGSGKTPVVIWLVEALRSKGFTPGIVSRGYGGTAIAPRAVRAGNSAFECGDEPLLLVERTGAPMWIGRKRAEVAKALLAANPEVNVIVTDDGLQHYALARDVEIVVLDEKVLGNRWPMPAGPMREPLSRLQSVQLVILHGEVSAALKQGFTAPTAVMQLKPGSFRRVHDSVQVTARQDLHSMRIKAVAGIGRPERFFETLRSLGLVLADTRAFPDHHQFSARDLALDGADALLMTEKDAIKCRDIAPPETWVLPVDAEIDPAALKIILECLHGPQAA